MNEKALDEIKATLTPEGREFFKRCVEMMDELMDGKTARDLSAENIMLFSILYSAFAVLGEEEEE